MRVSRLDKRIGIYKPVSETDEYGGRNESFELAGYRWAEFLRPNFSNRTLEGDGRAEIITQGIRLRNTDVETGWQVHNKGHIYEVLHVDESAKGEIILTTSEVN